MRLIFGTSSAVCHNKTAYIHGSDITFVSTSEETAYRSESLASRYPQLAIIDSLYTSLMFHLSDSGESLHKMRAAINLTKEEDW